MAIQQIQYDDKEAINIDSAVPDKNKCKADDLNEIKSVVNNNSYETPKVSSQVDTDYKVNVITTKNLFDKNTITNDKYIDNNGAIQTLSNVFYSDYIPVQPDTKYAISGKNNQWTVTALYDINKNFISRVNDVSNITTTASTYYIITMGSPAEINTIQVEQGEVATTYEPFIPNTINVNNEKYTDTINVGTSINDKNRVNVLYSENLYNIATNTNGKILKTDGSDEENADYCISDYIAVQPNTTYTISRVYENLPGGDNTIRLGLYTKSKTWIQRVDSSNNPWVYTTPSNCYFIRLSYQYTITNTNVQVEYGSTATTYQPYIIPSINVDGEEIYKQEKIEDFKDKITFNESLGDYNLFRKKGNLIMMNYQGANKAHTYNEVLFTIPVEYRPPITILVPFTAYGVVYGQLAIGTNGNCYINAISSESASGRICFTATYLTD